MNLIEKNLKISDLKKSKQNHYTSFEEDSELAADREQFLNFTVSGTDEFRCNLFPSPIDAFSPDCKSELQNETDCLKTEVSYVFNKDFCYTAVGSIFFDTTKLISLRY